MAGVGVADLVRAHGLGFLQESSNKEPYENVYLSREQSPQPDCRIELLRHRHAARSNGALGVTAEAG